MRVAEQSNDVYAGHMNDRLTTVENNLAAVQGETADLKHQVVALRSDVDGLKVETAALRTEVSVLKTGVSALKTETAKLSGKVDSLGTDMTRLLVLSTTFATKADMHEEINKQTWRIVTYITSYGTLMVGAVYYIARYVH